MNRLRELHEDRDGATRYLATLEERLVGASESDDVSPAWRIRQAIEDVKSRLKEIEEEISDQRE